MPCTNAYINNILKEVASVNVLLQHRSGSVSGYELQKSFGNALVKQIKVIKDAMSPDDASLVIDAVNGCAYKDEVKQQILAAIDSKLMQPKEPDNQKQPHCSGTFKTWWTYSTQED